MQFTKKGATLFIPDGAKEEQALLRTTHLCVCAHQDDIEFMAYNGIADCFLKPDKWFSGIVLTDGAGSPRSGSYAHYGAEEMMAVRINEQNAAAMVGGYSLIAQLHYSSAEVKDAGNMAPVDELARLILAMQPEIIYTHNLADSHGTHLATCLRVISAIKKANYKPKALYGMEVWRSLDWLSKEDKLAFDASEHPNIAASVSACFDSQISGGKRYDAAILGRRAANATFGASHSVDTLSAVAYGMDMTEALTISPKEFLQKRLERFEKEAFSLLDEVGGK